MKSAVFGILLFFVSWSAFAHEGHQAFYKLFVENGTLTLKAKLEIPDLRTAVEKLNFCSQNQDFNFCSGLWLIDQISVSVDDKTRAMTLESSTAEDGYLIFTFSLGKEPSEFQKLDFRNTAFTEAFDHYENILEIEMENLSQGYKLSETRTSISYKSK